MKIPRQKNFTLLELILAVAIFALVMLTVSMALSSLQQSWRKVQQHASRLKECQILERVFDSAFRNAVPFSWPSSEEKKEKSIFVGAPDKVSFAYMHRISSAEEGGIRFICLYLENDKLLARYRNTPILPWESSEDGGLREVLASDLARISFLYAETRKDGIGWTDNWSENQSPNIPAAIQITVEWKNGNKEVWLRRTAGMGPRESFGLRKEVSE